MFEGKHKHETRALKTSRPTGLSYSKVGLLHITGTFPAKISTILWISKVKLVRALATSLIF